MKDTGAYVHTVNGVPATVGGVVDMTEAEPAGWVRCPYATDATPGCPVRAQGTVAHDTGIGPVMQPWTLVLNECEHRTHPDNVRARRAAMVLGDPTCGPARAARALGPIRAMGWVQLADLPARCMRVMAHADPPAPDATDPAPHKPGTP